MACFLHGEFGWQMMSGLYEVRIEWIYTTKSGKH